jgi:hypothetical protein
MISGIQFSTKPNYPSVETGEHRAPSFAGTHLYKYILEPVQEASFRLLEFSLTSCLFVTIMGGIAVCAVTSVFYDRLAPEKDCLYREAEL